jgi:hypothetical protein
MSKVKQQLQQLNKLTIFSGNTIVVQVHCQNVAEINAVLAQYPEPEFTYKIVSFTVVV